MIYFEDSRVVSVNDLKQVVDQDGKRIYSERLVQGIENGDLNSLYEIDASDRNNKFFMEPILFAVKNSKLSTYEVYKYYGEELQKSDLTMAAEIVINEPDVLEDTAVVDDPSSVLYLAKINPEVILYMSEDLKNDGEFIEELSELKSKDVMVYVARECDIEAAIEQNPELANNAEFMREAIKEDATLLALATPELRNSYEFIRETSKENREVINYVVRHTEEFSVEALNGARESLQEHVISDAIKDVGEAKQKIQEEKESEDGTEKTEVAKELAKREKDLATIENAIEKFEKMSPEKKPRYAHIILTTTNMKQFQNMDKAYVIELEKYDQLYLAAKEKQRIENAKVKLDVFEITPEQIEEKTAEVRTSEINKVTREMREEYTRETNEKEVTEYDRGTDE